MPFQYLFGVEKGIVHIYSQSEGRGLWKIFLGADPPSLLPWLVFSIAPFPTIKGSCHVHSLGKIAVHIPLSK